MKNLFANPSFPKSKSSLPPLISTGPKARPSFSGTEIVQKFVLLNESLTSFNNLPFTLFQLNLTDLKASSSVLLFW
ncbi:Uncharacterised protein, partial [Mesomycoplasma hyorhinis]